jgi:hypothetical protein
MTLTKTKIQPVRSWVIETYGLTPNRAMRCYEKNGKPVEDSYWFLIYPDIRRTFPYVVFPAFRAMMQFIEK